MNTIVLRDGSLVGDERLARIEQFDERSKEFPMAKLTSGKRQRSYTWRCTSVLDQGTEGSCVGHGIAHELIARPAEVRDITHMKAVEIYKAAQKIDPWEGENYSGTSVLAGIKVGKELGYYDEYRWAFGIDDLIMGVGHNGPAVMGVLWYSDMFTPDEHNYIKASGTIAGGHCLLCNAVNVGEERFTLHNSWGKAWGRSGECYIKFEDMEKLLIQNGEACFVMHRHREV